MGESTSVNQSYNKPAKATRQTHSGVDWVLIGVVVGLTLFGLLMVYSAGPKFAKEIGSPADYFLKRQMVWAALAQSPPFSSAGSLTSFYQRITVPMMLVTMILLVTVGVPGRYHPRL